MSLYITTIVVSNSNCIFFSFTTFTLGNIFFECCFSVDLHTYIISLITKYVYFFKFFLYVLFQNIIIIVKSAVFTKCFEQSTKCHAIFIQYFKHKTCLVYNFSYCFSFLTLSTIYNTYVVLLILCYVSMFPFAISIIVYLAINRVRFF